MRINKYQMNIYARKIEHQQKIKKIFDPYDQHIAKN